MTHETDTVAIAEIPKEINGDIIKEDPQFDIEFIPEDEIKQEVQELKAVADITKNDILPSTWPQTYKCAYEAFAKWKRIHKISLSTQSIVIAYFMELRRKCQPSSLWPTYSMLKSTLKVKEKIDLDQYHTLKAFLNITSKSFKAKRTNVFSAENIAKFLNEAPDYVFLATKVSLQFIEFFHFYVFFSGCSHFWH